MKVSTLEEKNTINKHIYIHYYVESVLLHIILYIATFQNHYTVVNYTP